MMEFFVQCRRIRFEYLINQLIYLSFLFFKLLKALPILQKQLDALLEFDVSFSCFNI